MAFADQELTQRNFQALSQGLKDIRDKYAEDLAHTKRLEALVSSLQQDVATLRQQNGMLMARFHGTGSTS